MGRMMIVMMYATQYRESYPYYQHNVIGYNYRMSNICAGIGIGQMSVARAHIAHHRHIASLYEKAFASVQGIDFHKGPEWAAEGSNYWLNTITIDPSLHVIGQEHAYEKAVAGAVGGAAGVVHNVENTHTDCEPNANVEALRVYLNNAGIEARPLWKPMHKQPVYAGSVAYTNEIETELFKTGMCLPSGPCVSDEEVAYIVETIKEAVR